MEENPFNEDWKRGFQDGQTHSSPSPETRKLFSDIQKTLNSVDKRLALQEAKQDEHVSVLGKHDERITRLEMWRTGLAGAMAVITYLGLPNIIQVLSS